MPEMVSIPGGTFVMGSDDDPSEKPIHRVTIKPFAISKFPITVREWNACVAAKSCTYVPTGKDDGPVANLSWADAQQFVEWLSKVTQNRFGFRAKPNGSMPLAAALEVSFGGAISFRRTWPIVKDAINPTTPRNP